MINRNGRLWRGFIAATVATALVLGVGGCDNPPEALANAADALPQQIKDQRKEVDRAQKDFGAKLGTEKYAFLKAYTPAEIHADRFDQAKAKLNEAESAYKGKVKKVTDDYKNNRKLELEAGVAAVNELRDEARTLTADPPVWADKVVAVKADPARTLRESTTLVQGIKTGYDPVKTDVEKVKGVYARNAAAIDTAFGPLTALQSDAIKANGLLQAEAGKSLPNYAVMTTHAETVKAAATTFQKDVVPFKAKLTELNVRETHTLVDIRVDSVVMITRTTWDDTYDRPDEHANEYESLVDMETANYFSQFSTDQVLAVDGSGGFKTEKGVDRGRWDKLNIQPKNPKWHKGDSNAEWSYDGIEDSYCHKISVFKDGKKDISGRPNPAENYCSQYDTQGDLDKGMYWVEADDLDADAIGMDIYSKGVGDFAEQATTEATPPGMVYVGDTTTGAWKTDSNGNSFWDFYGPYLLFSQMIGGPSPYHYRYEYDDWGRSYRYSKRPYYGSYGGGQRYGAKSSLFSSRFPNSNFATSGLQNATVRNAGPAARAGGPGGGGK